MYTVGSHVFDFVTLFEVLHVCAKLSFIVEE